MKVSRFYTILVIILALTTLQASFFVKNALYSDQQKDHVSITSEAIKECQKALHCNSMLDIITEKNLPLHSVYSHIKTLISFHAGQLSGRDIKVPAPPPKNFA